MEVSVQIHAPAVLSLEKALCTWVGRRASLDEVAGRKKNPITVPARNWTPVAQLVA
jgi:hypothetical protein